MDYENKDDIKELVIREASSLFLKQGYTKTTIRQIADACNLGRGHLYYYFKKKEDIVLDLYKSVIEKIYLYINNSQSNNMDPLLNYAMTQYIYITGIVSNDELFRMYIEASSVTTLRNEYLVILKDLLKRKLMEIDYKGHFFSENDIRLSIIIGSAGEDELLRRYYNKNIDLTLEEIIKSTIKTRLLLLNISHNEVENIISKCSAEVLKIDINELINNINLLDI